jgi:hypothetical protein
MWKGLGCTRLHSRIGICIGINQMVDRLKRSDDLVVLELCGLLPAVYALEHPSVPSLTGVSNHFHCVLHYALHKSFGHCSRVIHSWRHVDLYQPRVQLVVDHEVIAHELTAVAPGRNTAFTALDAPDYDVLDALLYVAPLITPNMVSELVHGPHVAWNFSLVELRTVFLDRVVCEMDVAVVDVLQRVALSAEAHVALIVEPHLGWVKVLNEYPLPNIELPLVDQQRILDVLLRNILDVLVEAVIHDVEQVVEASNSSSTGKVVRLYYPNIVIAI